MSTSETKKPTELKKRVITGVIGGAFLILLIVFGGRLGVAFMAAILSLGMMYEFIEMAFDSPDRAEKRLVLLSMVWLLAFVNVLTPRSEYPLLVAAFILLFIYFIFSAGRHSDEVGLLRHLREFSYSMFGLLYLVFLPFFLPLIRGNPNGVHWTLLFLFIVWSGDTGAYFAGKKYGRRKLYPVISPKKTIEGGIGGLASSVGIAVIYKLAFFGALSWLGVIVIPIIVGVISQIGDLCESFVKRAFNKKDSGSILPGHGGFLDRFDGVVFSLPAMYACVRLFS